MSADTTIETQVWVAAGPIAKGDLLAAALIQVRDDIPTGTLPSADITDSKATKRDGEQGRLYTIAVTYRPLTANEGTVTVDDIVADLQPEPFDPTDHHDEA